MKKKIALATLAILPLGVASASATGQIGVVTANSLNIRSGPSTSYSVVATAKKNEKVTILGTSNGWYKVRLSSGKEGWGSGSYISKTNESNQVTSTNQKKVSVSSLNMRNGAGTSYRVITVLKQGTMVDVISESNGWTKIKYDGRIGYVSSQYLESVKVDNSQTITNKEVNTDVLNVRSGPSTSYSILGKLKKGQKVEVISEGNGWSKIKYNSRQAYVSSIYLSNVNTQPSKPDTKPESPKPENPGTSTVKKEVNTDALNVRSGPGTNYGILGKLKKGQQVDVKSESNGWSKITYNGKDAYVSSTYLSNISNKPSKPDTKPEEKPESPKPESPKPENPGTSTVKKEVNTDALNVRSGPGTNYGILGKLKKGQQVDVKSESNGWSKITYNGKDAYVSSTYLSDISNKPSKPDTKPEEKPDETPESKPENPSEGNSSATINYNVLSYTLNSHVSKQLERAAIGGNVIDSSKPRSSAMMTTFSMGQQSRAFVKADIDDIEYFLNPDNFTNSSRGMMQFLRIDSYKDGISEAELNNYLNSLAPASSGTNVFYNQGATFIKAAKKYNIDLAYLVSHAMWETGYGKSTLSQGQTITSFKGQALPQPVTVYNFFGIGAIDGSANLSGAEAAYSNGWTSIEATIDGSANWIAKNYIKSSKYNQNTIYKMKWNYDYTWHQYATDVNWANGISGVMNNIVKLYDSGSNLTFEVPKYK